MIAYLCKKKFDKVLVLEYVGVPTPITANANINKIAVIALIKSGIIALKSGKMAVTVRAATSFRWKSRYILPPFYLQRTARNILTEAQNEQQGTCFYQ